MENPFTKVIWALLKTERRFIAKGFPPSLAREYLVEALIDYIKFCGADIETVIANFHAKGMTLEEGLDSVVRNTLNMMLQFRIGPYDVYEIAEPLPSWRLVNGQPSCGSCGRQLHLLFESTREGNCNCGCILDLLEQRAFRRIANLLVK